MDLAKFQDTVQYTKLIVFLYTSSEHSKMKLRKQFIYSSIQKNNMLRNKFKEVIGDLYTKSYKTLLKETKENLSK